MKKNIKSDYVCSKLIDYSTYMENQFKVLGTTKIAHLAIYTLKKLNYIREYEEIYNNLSNEDKEIVNMLEKAF